MLCGNGGAGVLSVNLKIIASKNKGEILRICWHWKSGLTARAEANAAAEAQMSASVAEASLLFQRYAPQGSLSGSLYEDAKIYIASALSCANQEGWESGRYPGELTPDELSTGKKRSDYKWVYETLRAMQVDHIRACFGRDGMNFLQTCKLSLNGRIQRRRDFLRGPDTPRQRPSRKGRRDIGVPPSTKEYLPQPTLASHQIAKLFTAYLLMRQQT